MKFQVVGSFGIFKPSVILPAMILVGLGGASETHPTNSISHISVRPHVPIMKYFAGPGTVKVMPLLPCCDPALQLVLAEVIPQQLPFV